MGLGNSLRFPALCYRYGGGAFILAYLGVLVLSGVPLLCAELSLGRSGEPFPQSLGGLARSACGGKRAQRAGAAAGWAQCLNSAFVGLYYAAVAAYILYTGANILPVSLAGGGGAEELLFVSALGCGSGNFCLSPAVLLLIVAVWAVFFLFLSGGRERLARAARMTVPVPFFFFLALAARGLMYENGSAALAALFVPDFSRWGDASLWGNALGQALFSLSLSAGIMPSFARLMPRNGSLPKSAAAIAAANFAGCLLSSAAFFTSLYGCGLREMAGESGLVAAFCVYPAALVKMFPDPLFSGIFGILFYASLFLTALQSALSLLQAFVFPLAERKRLPQKTVAAGVCAVGLLCSSVFCTSLSQRALTLCDRMANGIVLPVLAAAECALFAVVLLKRTAAGGDRAFIGGKTSADGKNGC